MIRFLLSIVLLSLIAGQLSAQSKKKLRTYGISKKTETIVKYKDGKEEKEYVSQYEKYNDEGEWIEKVDLQKGGEIKKREVRKYDGDRIIEEIKDEPLEKEWTEKTPAYNQQRYTFAKDNLVKKEDVNRKGEVKETKVYTYNKFGDQMEEITTDKNGDLVQKEVYTYDKRGLKTEKRTFDKSGELLEVKKYMYE